MLEGNDELLLDRLIHEPARLAIMTVLSAVKAADFVFLQRATGLTKGNLSSHLTKLEEAGLLKIEKRFVNKKPNTNVELTPVGKQRIMNHWSQLDRLKKSVQGPRRGTALTGSPAPQSGDESFTTRVDRTANGHLQHSVHVRYTTGSGFEEGRDIAPSARPLASHR